MSASSVLIKSDRSQRCQGEPNRQRLRQSDLLSAPRAHSQLPNPTALRLQGPSCEHALQHGAAILLAIQRGNLSPNKEAQRSICIPKIGPTICVICRQSNVYLEMRRSQVRHTHTLQAQNMGPEICANSHLQMRFWIRRTSPVVWHQ